MVRLLSSVTAGFVTYSIFDILLSFVSHLGHFEANEYAFYLRDDAQSDIYSLIDLANGSSRFLVLPGQSTVIHDHLLTE